MVDYSRLNVYTSPSIGDNTYTIWVGRSNLLGFIAENNSLSTRWIQVYDNTATPTAGDVPILEIKLLTGQQSSFDPTAFNYLPLQNGLTFANSTTSNKYTAASAND